MPEAVPQLGVGPRRNGNRSLNAAIQVAYRCRCSFLSGFVPASLHAAPKLD